MNRTALFSTILLAVGLTFSSCTLVLLENAEGGHSPMQQLDGTWDVDESVEIENGKETVKTEVGGVFLNATRDQFGFCEGEWLEMNAPVKKDFLWGIKKDDTGDGEVFILHDENGNPNEWEVTNRTLKVFEIQRTENGITKRMRLKK